MSLGMFHGTIVHFQLSNGFSNELRMPLNQLNYICCRKIKYEYRNTIEFPLIKHFNIMHVCFSSFKRDFIYVVISLKIGPQLGIDNIFYNQFLSVSQYLISFSFEIDIFPDKLKAAVVIALIKRGSKHEQFIDFYLCKYVCQVGFRGDLNTESPIRGFKENPMLE